MVCRSKQRIAALNCVIDSREKGGMEEEGRGGEVLLCPPDHKMPKGGRGKEKERGISPPPSSLGRRRLDRKFSLFFFPSSFLAASLFSSPLSRRRRKGRKKYVRQRWYYAERFFRKWLPRVLHYHAGTHTQKERKKGGGGKGLFLPLQE